MSDDLGRVNSQVRFVIESMKSKIAREIMSRCSMVSVIKYVNFDRVRLLASSFKDFEIPAIQLIDINLSSVHEGVRAKKTWQIALELLMKGDENFAVSQVELWNLEYELLRKLWAVPNLGIKGVIQMNYLGTQTDLHLLEPYYFARLDFEVLFYEDLVRPC